MQVDADTVKKYEREAPELLEAVTSGEAEHIMKRDPETDYCVKFQDGLCSIHASRGEGFLGDACHFFPRITRAFGEVRTMAASLSCPEIARLTLLEEDAFERVEEDIERLPYSLKNYLPEGMAPEDALTIQDQLVQFALDTDRTPERAAASLILLLFTLEGRKEADWPMTVKMYLSMVENMLPTPQSKQELDYYFLLQTLRGLIFASKKTARPRLEATFTRMEKALGMEIDRNTLDILLNPQAEGAVKRLEEGWKNHSQHALFANVLRRWLATQLTATSLPFSGFGRDMKEKAVILAVRFATVRLALMALATEQETVEESAMIETVQSLARFMDHLSDPELSMNLYRDAEWLTEARLRALVGDLA